MKKISTLGIDLAKNSFQVCAMDEKGKVLFNKKLKRDKFLSFTINLELSTNHIVAMEACSSSNYWGRKLQSHGFLVKLISPQFVKPYVKSNKNDAVDAEAIAEASRRPTMRFVGVKSVYQQDIKAVHNVRASLVKRKTALSNEIRAMLFEYGQIIPKGIAYTQKQVPRILEDADNELSTTLRDMVQELYSEFLEVIKKIEKYNSKIDQILQENERCQKILQVPGVGPITATAIFAAVGDVHVFKNGREFAAWLGLTPRQHSTGGKTTLLGISKRGDKYIRKNLVHGCRSVVAWADKKEDRKSKWIQKKVETRGTNKAVVALANKQARAIWAIMKTGEDYKVAA